MTLTECSEQLNSALTSMLERYVNLPASPSVLARFDAEYQEIFSRVSEQAADSGIKVFKVKDSATVKKIGLSDLNNPESDDIVISVRLNCLRR